MELKGKIIAVLPAKSGVSARTGNPWMSQEYVIEVPGQYPKRCVFTLFGEERIRQFNIQMGEEVTVSFDIDANEYQGKWYNKVQAYNVTRAQQQATKQQPAQGSVYGGTAAPPQPQQASLFPPQQPANDEADDLPF